MRSLIGGAVALIAAAELVTGCSQFTTYGYQYRVQQSFGGEEPEQATREARQLLANARTVAFFPPDICVNVDAVAVQSDLKARLLKANCGVLMSSLERAAENAGYEVVSWQNLRGGYGKRPIDFARESSVDVLFEVNEFDLGYLFNSEVQQTLAFFERDNGVDKPVAVSNQLAQQCAGYAKNVAPTKKRGKYGTIDIKTVSVVDGRARWRYRKVLSIPYANERPALFQGMNQPRPLVRLLTVVGGLALITGATLITLEQVSTDDPLTPQDDHFNASPWSVISTIGGLAMLGGAIAIHYNMGTEKPAPASVLCDSKFAIPDPIVVAPTNTPTTYSTEHTFESTEANDMGRETKEIDELRGTMIQQFVEELKAVHPVGRAAPPPSPPPAPAPAPAPSAAPGATPGGAP